MNSAFSELKRKQAKNGKQINEVINSEKKHYGKLPKLAKLPTRNENNKKLYSVKF